MIDPVGCDSQRALVQSEARQRLRLLMVHMLQFVSSIEAETSRGFTAWLTLESYAAETESALHVLMQRLVAAQDIEHQITVGALYDDLRRTDATPPYASPERDQGHKGAGQREIVDDWLRIVQQAIDNLHDLASGVHLMSVNDAKGYAAAPRRTI